MEKEYIRELLTPYLGERQLSAEQIDSISIYIDILMRWNERTNLTSIRDPEQIVRRHFGESLFAAAALLEPGDRQAVIDVGSGAGFPGLPMKIFAPKIRLILIEAHSKKNTFLREVVRSLGMSEVEVYLGRAENFPSHGDLVTLRAVEKFKATLPVAARLVAADGRLAMMVGGGQVSAAKSAVPGEWLEPQPIPASLDRVLLVKKS